MRAAWGGAMVDCLKQALYLPVVVAQEPDVVIIIKVRETRQLQSRYFRPIYASFCLFPPNLACRPTAFVVDSESWYQEQLGPIQ